MRLGLLLFILSLVLSSCSPKGYSLNSAGVEAFYCIKEFYFENPEPALNDLLYKALVDGVISANGKLECSERSDYYLEYRIGGVSFYSIGYSPSLRASVFVAQLNSNLRVVDREGKVRVSGDIVEKIQYVGSGMRADFEKRYAFVDLAEVVKIRIYSLLTSHGD